MIALKISIAAASSRSRPIASRNRRVVPRAEAMTTIRIFFLTTNRDHAKGFVSSLIEGRLRRHPEGGAGSSVLRQRLVTACSGRLGTPPARHYDLAARSSLYGSEGAAGAEGDGSAAPGEKPPRWSAERRASRVISAFTRVFDAIWHAARVFRSAPERLSALRPPLDSESVKQGCKTGRKCAAGTRRCVCLRS